jgi:hypothetical protein
MKLSFKIIYQETQIHQKQQNSQSNNKILHEYLQLNNLREFRHKL